MVGKRREPALVAILCGITFHVYWFYWLRMAFQELADDVRKDLRTFQWLCVLIPVWFVSFLLGAVAAAQMVVEAFRNASAKTPPNPFAAFAPHYTPLLLASIAFYAVFLVLQLVFLRSLTDAVGEASRAVNGAKPAAFGLAIAATALLLGGQLPYVGLLAGLGAVACEIIWTVQMQQALNGYWARRVSVPPAMYPRVIPPVRA